jgi:rod shape-determining protein MreD
MSARLSLRVALVIFVVLIAQSTVVLSIRIDGAHPDLLWLLPITAALLGGPDVGALVGFWSGLAFDLILPTPFGLSAFIGCLLGYIIGTMTTAVDKRAVWLRPVAAIFGSVAADMLFAVTGALFGQDQMVRVNFVAIFAVVALSSLVLVLPVNRMMRWAMSVDGQRRSLVSAQAPESGLW